MTKQPQTKKRLQPKIEMFCNYYAGIGQETFGNGTTSYMQAYNKPGRRYSTNYESSRAAAAKLLANPSVLKRVDEILKSYNNNETVDKERAWIIVQRENPIAKIMAIKSYDDLVGRITKKIKLSGGVKSNLNDHQMTTMAELVLKKAKIKK